MCVHISLAYFSPDMVLLNYTVSHAPNINVCAWVRVCMCECIASWSYKYYWRRLTLISKDFIWRLLLRIACDIRQPTALAYSLFHFEAICVRTPKREHHHHIIHHWIFRQGGAFETFTLLRVQFICIKKDRYSYQCWVSRVVSTCLTSKRVSGRKC